MRTEQKPGGVEAAGLGKHDQQHADYSAPAPEGQPASAVPLVPDTDAAIKFLQAVCPDGFWVLTAIEPDGPGIETVTFVPTEVIRVDRARAWIDSYNGRWNLYWQVNPPIKALTKKAARIGIKEVRFFHLDIDPRKDETVAEAQDRIKKRLMVDLPKDVPPPTVIIASGGGLQALWRLEQPIPVNGDVALAEDAERYNRWLEVEFGADKCFDVSRVLRLPGSINRPNKTKRDKGRVPALACLVEHDPARVYPESAFKKAAAKSDGGGHGGGGGGHDHAGGGSGGHAGGGIGTGPLPKVDLGTLPISPRMRMVAVQGDDPDQPYPSRSEAQWAVTLEMVRAGVGADVVASVLLDPDLGVSAHVRAQKGPRKYAERQIARARDEVAQGSARYRVIGGALHYMKPTKDGIDPVRLCNFDARIEEERKLDDGVTSAIHFQLAGTLANGTPLAPITMPAQDLKDKWWVKMWGAAPIVTPGNGGGETHLLPAIQTVSAPVPKRTIYAHLGWRKLDDQWLYLHGGGAIGVAGAVEGYETELDGELKHFSMHAPVDLKRAVTASLGMLELGPVGVALAAATYRAPLGQFCEIDFSLFVAGDSGVFKSAAAALAQCHWGSRWWKGREFPANWSSTANTLEKQACVAKDAVLVVDDFAPKESHHEAEKQHQTAERLLRGVGNRSGRGRMNADTNFRRTFWPRGMLISTGEDVPKGYSLSARTVVVKVKKGEINRATLSVLQSAARDGLLAQSMAGFLVYIAEQAEELPERLAARSLFLRNQISADHARTPDNIASLLLGLESLLAFAKDVDAITAAEAKALWAIHSEELIAAASGQDRQQESEKPAERFRRFVNAALQAGRVHLCNRKNGAPEGREAASGWRRMDIHALDQKVVEAAWNPRGDCIGFVEGDELWLIPDAAYACAENLARQQNKSLGITEKTLGERLDEAGWIQTKDKERYTKKLGGQRVYHLALAEFLPGLLPPAEEQAAMVGELPFAVPPTSEGEPAALDQDEFERLNPPMGEPAEG